jgi:hypothetical protein
MTVEIKPPVAPPRPYGYSYNVQQIFLSIQCVMQGSAGFRCVARIFNLIEETMTLSCIPTPAFSTMRDWLLKLGLYNLTQPKSEGEWIWIVDCSIQMGAMKCLLILGVRVEDLREKNDFTLSHANVEALVLKTIESCPGEVVKMALDEAKSKTKGALAIVSDEGTELKKGVRLFQEEQKDTERPIHVHDVMHKIDLILKKELEKDADWKQFTKALTDTTQQLKLSSSSHLIPPKQRQKKRMRSEIDIVEWGFKILKHLDSGNANEIETEKLSWILNFRSQVSVYQEMALIFDMSTEEVRRRGYHKGTVRALREQGDALINSERSRAFFTKILKAIEEETNKVLKDHPLIGSSEVIESIFGKFKQLEKNHSAGGLTSLVLGIPAFVGKTALDVVQKAMETITIDNVKNWIDKNLGQTFWSKRREKLLKSTEDDNYLESDDLLNACTS